MGKQHVAGYYMARQKLADEYVPLFDDLVGDAYPAKGVAAAIEYLTTDQTQDEVGRKYNVGSSQVANMARVVEDKGGLDE